MSPASAPSADMQRMLRPFVVATITGTLTSAIVRWFLYGRYINALPGPSMRHLTLLDYVSPYSAVVVAGWAAVFAVAWTAWPWLRSDVGSVGGRIRITLVFGSVIWLVTRFLLGVSALGGPFILDWYLWVVDTVAIGSSIAWSFALFGPDARSAVPSATRMRAYTTICVALMLGLPSASFVRWYMTSKDAGFLMILGVLILLAAFLGIVIALILTAISVRKLATNAAT